MKYLVLIKRLQLRGTEWPRGNIIYKIGKQLNTSTWSAQSKFLDFNYHIKDKFDLRAFLYAFLSFFTIITSTKTRLSRVK